MGVLSLFKKKKLAPTTEEEKILDGAESSEVLVPNHAKLDTKSSSEGVEVVKLVHKENQINRFRINGVYDVGLEMMISGVVESGKVRKKMKSKLNGKDAVINDIKVGSDSVEELIVHEEGTIFLRGKHLHLLKYNDLLEFK
jgi:hypothetical protein